MKINKEKMQQIKINQEGIERNEEQIERIQESLERNQERIEEITINHEEFERDLEEIERNLEEIQRILEEDERRERINDNEMNNILNQLSVTIIEDIKRLNDENKRCVICLEDFKNFDKSIYLPCIHLFHEKCITDWINTKKVFCPVCRAKISNMIK